MYATEQLRDDHEVIQVVLAVLEAMAERLDAGRGADPEHLAQALDFLRNFADKCHHGKEEDHLFPALAAAGIPTEGGPIGVMLMEHTQGRAYIQGMGRALDEIRAGKDGAAAFAENALGYAELLRSHILKENNILFAIAEHHLSPDEHARLAGAFEQVERERIGPGAHERYHQVVHALRDAYLLEAVAA